MEGAAAALLRTPPVAGSSPTETHAPAVILLQRMAELGLAFDPAVPVYESRCSKCGATKPDDTELYEQPAKLYVDGNAKEPLAVCWRVVCVALWDVAGTALAYTILCTTLSCIC